MKPFNLGHIWETFKIPTEHVKAFAIHKRGIVVTISDTPPPPPSHTNKKMVWNNIIKIRYFIPIPHFSARWPETHPYEVPSGVLSIQPISVHIYTLVSERSFRVGGQSSPDAPIDKGAVGSHAEGYRSKRSDMNEIGFWNDTARSNPDLDYRVTMYFTFLWIIKFTFSEP